MSLEPKTQFVSCYIVRCLLCYDVDNARSQPFIYIMFIKIQGNPVQQFFMIYVEYSYTGVTAPVRADSFNL